MERNANHINPSYCHLPVSCRSLVDRRGSLGAVSHKFNFSNFNSFSFNKIKEKRKRQTEAAHINRDSIPLSVDTFYCLSLGNGKNTIIINSVLTNITKSPAFLTDNSSNG